MDEKFKKDLIEFLKENLSIEMIYRDSECMGEQLKLIVRIEKEIITVSDVDLY